MCRVTQVSGQWVPKHRTGYWKGPTTICCKPVRWYHQLMAGSGTKMSSRGRCTTVNHSELFYCYTICAIKWFHSWVVLDSLGTALHRNTFEVASFKNYENNSKIVKVKMKNRAALGHCNSILVLLVYCKVWIKSCCRTHPLFVSGSVCDRQERRYVSKVSSWNFRPENCRYRFLNLLNTSCW